MEIIGVIIAGAIIGALARLVMPGRQGISALVTVILGILGVLIGYYLAAALGVAATNGIDWLRWIISIIVAVVLIAIYIAVTGRRGTSNTRI
ncbi:GlsB/YeaQ/YmgE family stress response membrane protein [Pedococcus sp. 5OH_020]|uniref:GlsB/YeaQ/YmgE family stress response membrane protein n=1 Tax=Pedococcus sp. 5OH_020 TaxID=2989814 RepID=UPI0022E9C3CD|nr:GlsB/YeaQ/YmgE family stress response membrane protein [Pedococcus sp. 5OH_020]